MNIDNKKFHHFLTDSGIQDFLDKNANDKIEEIIVRFTSLIRIILIGVALIFCCVCSTLSIIINPTGTISHYFIRLGGFLILWISGITLHTKGLENIDKNKIQVFASNHSSNMDVPVLMKTIPVKTGWVAKKELFKIPIFGQFMMANGYIAIDRGDGRKAVESLKLAVDKIKSGRRIAIFPEGTRSIDGELQPFKKMLFKLCLKTGVPIVPIYIDGANSALKPHSLLIYPGDVYVRAGKPIETTDYAPNKVGDLMDDFKIAMHKLQVQILEDKANDNMR